MLSIHVDIALNNTLVVFLPGLKVKFMACQVQDFYLADNLQPGLVTPDTRHHDISHLPHSSSSHETPGPEQGETGAANFLQRPAQPIVRQLVTSDWSPKSSQASYWLKLAHKFAKCERIHRRRVGDKMLPRRHTHWSPHAALATRHRKCPPEGWVAGWRQ